MHPLLVGLATYNERENLPRLTESLFRVQPRCDLLIVDDHSPDGTGAWCDEVAKRDSRVHVIHRPGKAGLGTATLEIIRYAVEHEYHWLITLDADLSHDPVDIERMLTAIQSHPDLDVVVGSRYVVGGRIVGWPWHRRLISRLVNWTAHWGLGLPVRDCSGAFRCYRVAALANVNWCTLRSRGYSIYEETLVELHRRGARMVETPITFSDRAHGATKAGLREMITSAWQLLRLLMSRLVG